MCYQNRTNTLASDSPPPIGVAAGDGGHAVEPDSPACLGRCLAARDDGAVDPQLGDTGIDGAHAGLAQDVEGRVVEAVGEDRVDAPQALGAIEARRVHHAALARPGTT